MFLKNKLKKGGRNRVRIYFLCCTGYILNNEVPWKLHATLGQERCRSESKWTPPDGRFQWADLTLMSCRTIRPPRLFWYFISFSACSLSSSDCFLKKPWNPGSATSSRSKYHAWKKKRKKVTSALSFYTSLFISGKVKIMFWNLTAKCLQLALKY